MQVLKKVTCSWPECTAGALAAHKISGHTNAHLLQFSQEIINCFFIKKGLNTYILYTSAVHYVTTTITEKG